MNAVRWWQRAAGLLMVLFLLTVGWKMRAFIWTAVQNAVVRSWYPVWGTNLRDIPDSEDGKRHRLAGWKKQTQGEADPSYYKYLEEQEVRQEYTDFLAQFSGSRLVMELTWKMERACSWKWETGRRRDRRREAV